MKIRNIFLLLATVALLFTGCKDFQELNTNPNQPEEVEPSLLLPGVIRASVNSQVMESYLTGNIVTQKASKTLRVENEIYEWGSFANTWFPMYETLRDVKNIEQIAAERGDASYEGIALVMRAWIFSILTDAYGDIPYFEALEAKDGNNTPTYATQKEIYMNPDEGLLALLDQANNLLDPSATVEGDILYGGDVGKWKKLANSLRLRLLMRITETNEAGFATSEMQEMIDDPATYPVFESNADNAALEYTGSFPNEYPLNPLKIGDKDAVVISQLLVDTFKSMDDPRLMVFARPASSGFPVGDYDSYIGRPNGFLPQNVPPPFNDTSFSRLGPIYYDYPDFQNAPELADGLIMTYAELQFILAEAQVRGFVTTSMTTEELYRSGVKANMDYYEVDYANTGLTDFNAYYNQTLVDLSNASDPLQYIGFQKWVATWFTGLEGWFDWRRTRVPELEPADNSVIGNTFPTRFIYPGEEQNLNQENYQEAVSRMGDDQITNSMWLTE